MPENMSIMVNKLDECMKQLSVMDEKLDALVTGSGQSARPTDAEPDADAQTDTTTATNPDWLLIDRRGDNDFGLCRVCLRHSTDKVTTDPWTNRGVFLGDHRKQKLTKHSDSKRHRDSETSSQTYSTRQLETMTDRLTDKARRATELNMTIAYSDIIRGHAYSDFEHQHLLLDTIGVNVGNQHQTHTAAAQCVDVIYETFRDEVTRHIMTPNTVTGRDRHIHLTMDKFTVAGVQRQAVNMRLLDVDGMTVVVHGTTAVIRQYDDPVPIYTATLPPSTVRDSHEADGRGVFCHVTDFLTNELGLTYDEITRHVTSSSADCEGVYSGRVNGFGRIWRQKYSNPSFIHLDDRDHRLETLLDRVRGEDACDWMDRFYDKLTSIISLFTSSPLLKRQLRRTADDLDLISISFQRLIETRFVAYLVEAVERVLANRSVAVTVLRDMIGSGTLARDAAKVALQHLEDPGFLLDALVIIDAMHPAIALTARLARPRHTRSSTTRPL